MSIPVEFEYVYHQRTETNMFGEGYLYQVFKNEENISNFYRGFENGPSELAEEGATEILDEIGVPEDERPDFSHQYKWKKLMGKEDLDDDLYIFFDEELEQFYLVEDAF